MRRLAAALATTSVLYLSPALTSATAAPASACPASSTQGYPSSCEWNGCNDVQQVVCFVTVNKLCWQSGTIIVP